MTKQVLFAILILFISINSLFAQEEFFENQTGFSGTYLSIPDYNTSGGAFSFTFDSGVNFGFGHSDNVTTLSLGKYNNEQSNSLNSNFYYGASYSFLNNANGLGLDFGLSIIIHKSRNFPTSLNGNFGINYYMLDNDDSFYSRSNEVILGYAFYLRQAFFYKSGSYPHVALGYVGEASSNEKTFVFMLGFNLAFN